MNLTKASFEKIYKTEQDVKAKERMLLVLNVVYHNRVAAQVSNDLNRNRTWACVWLKRYDKEGIGGLKDKPKSGRPSELSKDTSYQIKQELKQNNHGWTTKQVEELIIKKSGIKYHYTHIYRILRKWGFKHKVQEKYILIQHPKKRKTISKKGCPDTCG